MDWYGPLRQQRRQLVSPSRRLRVAGGIFAFAAVAQSPTTTLLTASNTNGNDECVPDALNTEQAPAWVCLGDELSYNAGTDAKPDWKQKHIGPPDSAAALVSDDTWCENVSACAVLGRPSADGNIYTARVKGNAAFGDATGVLGTFDVIWRSSLNGPRPRWRLHLVWDSGHAVVSDVWEAWTRKEDFLSDTWFCFADFAPNNISSASPSAWSPSSTTYRDCSAKMNDDDQWHDELSGRFESWGKSFEAGVLHTAHWVTWQKKDGSYGAKMTEAWGY